MERSGTVSLMYLLFSGVMARACELVVSMQMMGDG